MIGIESEDGRVSSVLIRDMQKCCTEIWAMVGKIGNACLRIELLDPDKVT